VSVLLILLPITNLGKFQKEVINILFLMFDRVYLTGFKKFGDHDVNPTQMLAEHFATLNISGLTCSVIEVTVEDVDSYINKTKQLIA
jgi:hypothetical protein